MALAGLRAYKQAGSASTYCPRLPSLRQCPVVEVVLEYRCGAASDFN